MIKRWDIGTIRMMASINSIVKVVGVNSYLGDGKHILMWDFDDNSYEEVLCALRIVQTRYFLSNIHIAKTKETGGYHAFCFTAVDWRQAVEIVASTFCVDMAYLKWSLFRGRFTLRVSEKMGRIPKKIATLEGYKLPDVEIKDLKSWVVYETVGGKEWVQIQLRSWSNLLTRLTYPLKRLLPIRSGKKL